MVIRHECRAAVLQAGGDDQVHACPITMPDDDHTRECSTRSFEFEMKERWLALRDSDVSLQFDYVPLMAQ